MRLLTSIVVPILALCFVAPAPTSAQDVQGQRPLRPLRIAKWGTLAAAAGGAIYGFVQNHRADDRFNELEQLCQEQPVRCSMRAPDGAYQDAEFEQLYQDVHRLDRRAHTGLLLGQISVAASVVFFLLDLDNTRRPPDIPFVPPAQLVRRHDGSVALEFSLPVR